ncbi:MAG: alcohol dehydrogenase, class [Clostridia bacterium]|jgi:alcohol dehydrogenase|nr:alcohol dehydrogenase, class [Clostridia bacterium]
MDWLYKQPVEIIFGVDKIGQIAEILRDKDYRNGLLVSDPLFMQNGLAAKIINESGGRIKACFDHITPNPSVKQVDECAQIIREQGYEFVVALGGGSSLDCAKAAAVVALTDRDTRAFHSMGEKLPDAGLPIIAIPTTAGTGSEATGIAVLTDEEKSYKAPLASPMFFPKIAIIDPTVTLTVPPYVTACTGLDVLSHAIEGYWSKNHQPACDALAIYAADLVFKYLPELYRKTDDLEARTRLCEASVIAGMAFWQPKTTGSHACSFPLTNMYHIPHGEACAFTLDAFIRINAESEGGRVHALAEKCGFKDAYSMADKVLDMKRDMGMITTLEEAGINLEALDKLVEESMHPNMLNNPVAMSKSDIKAMYLGLGK